MITDSISSAIDSVLSQGPVGNHKLIAYASKALHSADTKLFSSRKRSNCYCLVNELSKILII